jgi:hypothetical protein
MSTHPTPLVVSHLSAILTFPSRLESTASVALAVSSSAMRKLHCARHTILFVPANNAPSIEHNDVDIVAVNDPFIEPHYAVS